jgi:hypothetical protein
VHAGNKQSPAQQIDHRALFYEKYHKEAEDFDKEFMKKYDEDLNTTLIFVSRLPEHSDRGLLID